jgi:hypothetical protein
MTTTSSSSSLVSLGSFQSVIPNGTLDPQATKRFDVYNLSKAGAVQIGNILFKYDNPNGEDDIVEILRNAGMPPSAYPSIDIFNPRFNITNTIVIGRFSILVQKQTIQGVSLSYPSVRVNFNIIETSEVQIQVQRPAPPLQTSPVALADDVWEQEFNANAMLIDSDPFCADAMVAAATTVTTTTTVTRTQSLKTITANFTINTQFLIRRLQMFFRRFIFKIRCHRRRMMLCLACMAQKQFLEQENTVFNLAALMDDPQGGVLRDVILCALAR